MIKIQKKLLCVATALMMAVSVVPGAMTPAKSVEAKTVKLAAPQDVKATAKGSYAVNVTWAKVDNATSYRVYRATKKKGSYTRVATTTKLTKKVKSLKANKTYYFKVAAYSSTNGRGKYSTIVSAKTEKDTVKTMAFKLKQSGKHAVKVTWKRVEGAQGFQLANRISTKTKSTIQVKSGKKYSTSYLSVRKKTGKTYFYKMRTYKFDKKGKRVYSPWTAEQSITIK